MGGKEREFVFKDERLLEIKPWNLKFVLQAETKYFFCSVLLDVKNKFVDQKWQNFKQF